MADEAPPLLRVISSVLMFFGALGIAVALVSFAYSPWWLASAVVALSLVQFMSYVGLRRLRLWGVYLFFACVAVSVASTAYFGISAFASSPIRILSLTLPLVLFLVAWFPNRSDFS
jgi:hypothetical protein